MPWAFNLNKNEDSDFSLGARMDIMNLIQVKKNVKREGKLNLFYMEDAIFKYFFMIANFILKYNPRISRVGFISKKYLYIEYYKLHYF